MVSKVHDLWCGQVLPDKVPPLEVIMDGAWACFKNVQ